MSTPKHQTIFKYSAKVCTTEDMCYKALAYYDSIKHEVLERNLNNYREVVQAINVRLRAFYKEPTIETMDGTREFFYKQALILSVEFLRTKPDPVKLTRLYNVLRGAMKLSGVSWNAELMYSDIALFHLAPTKNEKIIQFIHSVLISGLRTNREISKLINMYIKLINVLQLSKQINVDLPNKKILHNISFAPILNY